MDQRVGGEPPPRGAFVRRFEGPTRLAHWLLAAPFLLLMLTGLTNFAPELKALQVADVRVFAWMHVVLGFASLGAAVVALGQLGQRSAREDLRGLARFSTGDYLWLQHHAITWLGGRSVPPRTGKFNAGQKLNAMVSMAAVVGLLGTGVVLGVNYVTKEVFAASFVARVFPWHTLLALAFLPVLLGHLYLALLHPSTREALRGITVGRVRREWAARHHDAWVEATDGPGAGGAESARERHG